MSRYNPNYDYNPNGYRHNRDPTEAYDPNARAFKSLTIENNETSSNNAFSIILFKILIPLVLLIITLILTVMVGWGVGLIMGIITATYWVFVNRLGTFDAYICGRCVEGSMQCAVDNCS